MACLSTRISRAPLPFAGLSYVNLESVRPRRAGERVLWRRVRPGVVDPALPSRGHAGKRTAVDSASRRGTAIASSGTDANNTRRIFCSGRRSYQPAFFDRLTPRVRATLDYSLDVTGLERTVNTPALFELPPPIVNHGALARD